jgi:membrane protein implicated in regulation of membrane protease activity
MLYAYLFSLIVGGLLVGASVVFGGGHDADTGAGDLDAGDAETGADTSDVAGHAGGHSGALDALGGLVAIVASVRFWTFFAAFFGLTGLVLEGLELAPRLVALPAALGLGLLSGLGVTYAFRRLAREDSNSAVGAGDYVGKTAKVLVPVSKGGLGKVRLTLRGSTVDVLAVTDEDGEIGPDDEVLVVEMDGTRARVARTS